MFKKGARAKSRIPNAKQVRHDVLNLTSRVPRSKYKTSCRVYWTSITMPARTEIAACLRLNTYSSSILVTIQASQWSKLRSKGSWFPCNIRPPKLSWPTSNTATTRLIPSRCSRTASLNSRSLLRPASRRATHTKLTRMRGLQCLTSAASSTVTSLRLQMGMASGAVKYRAYWRRVSSSTSRRICATFSQNITKNFNRNNKIRCLTPMNAALRSTTLFWIVTRSCSIQIWT